jgi:hypothetical protein
MNYSEASRSVGPGRSSGNTSFVIPEELSTKTSDELFQLAKTQFREVLRESRASGRIGEDLVWIDEILDMLSPINEYYNPQASIQGYLEMKALSTSFDPRVQEALYALWLGIQKMKERGNTIFKIARKVREFIEILTPTVFNRNPSRSVWEARRSRKSRKTHLRGGRYIQSKSKRKSRKS